MISIKLRDFHCRTLLRFLPPPVPKKPAYTTVMGQYPWTEVFILLEVLNLAALYPTRQHAYRVVVNAAITYIAVQVYQVPEVSDSLILAYSVGCMVAHRYLFRMYLLFAEGPFPDHWRRVRDEVHTKADASDAPGDLDLGQPSNFPLTKKLWWTVDLAYHGLRMIGWVQEPKNCLPPRPPPSRRTFLWKTSLKLIVNIVVADLASFMLARTPAFDSSLHDPADGPETYLAAVPLLHRTPYVLALAFSAQAIISMTHNVQALVCVGLFNSSPTLWPDMWGRWSDGYTLRKLWG